MFLSKYFEYFVHLTVQSFKLGFCIFQTKFLRDQRGAGVGKSVQSHPP